MKKQNIGFLILFLGLLGLSIEKCRGKDDFVPKQDTVVVNGRQPDDGLFQDSAIVKIFKKRSFEDSNSLTASFRIDTSYYLLQVLDTLRDSLKHPLFYPNHTPKYLRRYSPIPVDDSLTQFVQIVNLPHRNKK